MNYGGVETVVSNGANGLYDEKYEYAANGNLTRKGDPNNANDGLYSYTDSNHPHATTGYRGDSYEYNNVGSMKERTVDSVTRALKYDRENRLIAVWQGATSVISYTYDADGVRVMSETPSLTTYYVGDYYEENSDGDVRKNYFIGGQLVAVRSSGFSISDGLYYILQDYLGSTSVTTEDDGTYESEIRYRAYGADRYTNGTQATDRLYTGQQWESDLELYDYGARFYDPILGRFISPDTIVPEPGDPQALNRYAYSNNNPTRYTDPTGHWTEDELAGMLGPNWRTLYFGEGAVFEGRDNLLNFLLSDEATSPVMLGILPWIMVPANVLHTAGVDLSGYDALGFRAVGAAGRGVFGSLTGDFLLNLNSGEFSAFVTPEAGLQVVTSVSGTMGWFAVSNLADNDAYSGAVSAHGGIVGGVMATSYEQFWSSPMSADVYASDMPHGQAVTIGGGGGLGVYRTVGSGYEIYRMNAQGSQWNPTPFNLGQALSEIGTALLVDLKQWKPRRW